MLLTPRATESPLVRGLWFGMLVILLATPLSASDLLRRQQVVRMLDPAMRDLTQLAETAPSPETSRILRQFRSHQESIWNLPDGELERYLRTYGLDNDSLNTKSRIHNALMNLYRELEWRIADGARADAAARTEQPARLPAGARRTPVDPGEASRRRVAERHGIDYDATVGRHPGPQPRPPTTEQQHQLGVQRLLVELWEQPADRLHDWTRLHGLDGDSLEALEAQEEYTAFRRAGMSHGEAVAQMQMLTDLRIQAAQGSGDFDAELEALRLAQVRFRELAPDLAEVYARRSSDVRAARERGEQIRPDGARTRTEGTFDDLLTEPRQPPPIAPDTSNEPPAVATYPSGSDSTARSSEGTPAKSRDRTSDLVAALEIAARLVDIVDASTSRDGAPVGPDWNPDPLRTQPGSTSTFSLPPEVASDPSALPPGHTRPAPGTSSDPAYSDSDQSIAPGPHPDVHPQHDEETDREAIAYTGIEAVIIDPPASSASIIVVQVVTNDGKHWERRRMAFQLSVPEMSSGDQDYEDVARLLVMRLRLSLLGEKDLPDTLLLEAPAVGEVKTMLRRTGGQAFVRGERELPQTHGGQGGSVWMNPWTGARAPFPDELRGYGLAPSGEKGVKAAVLPAVYIDANRLDPSPFAVDALEVAQAIRQRLK